jgi:hypothetical protein
VREPQPVWVQEHREKRLAFASNKALPPSSQILFSDEAWVYQMDSGRIEWVYPGEEATPIERDRYCKTLMIFGIIGVGVRRLKIFSQGQGSTVNTQKYITVLRTVLLPLLRTIKYSHFYYMQDNAPAHKSKATLHYLVDEHNVKLLPDWPPKSPDLNPIENLWAQLKHRISPLVHRRGLDLEAAIRQAWADIPQPLIDSLVVSFESRLAKCRVLAGSHVQHASGHRLSTVRRAEERREG